MAKLAVSDCKVTENMQEPEHCRANLLARIVRKVLTWADERGIVVPLFLSVWIRME